MTVAELREYLSARSGCDELLEALRDCPDDAPVALCHVEDDA